MWETLQKWAYLGYIECLIHHGITKSGSSAISSSPIGISCTAITLIPLPLMSLMTKLFDFIHLRWDVILDFFTCVIKRSIWWKILSMQDCYNVLIVQNCLESIEVSLPSQYKIQNQCRFWIGLCCLILLLSALASKKNMHKHVLCALNSGIGRNTYRIWCISQHISITTRSSIRARNGILLQEKGKFDRLPRRDMHCEKTCARKDTVYYGRWDKLASTAHEHSQRKHFLLTYARLFFLCLSFVPNM